MQNTYDVDYSNTMKTAWSRILCKTFYLAFFVSASLVFHAQAQDIRSASGPHIEVKLLNQHSALVPGQSTTLGILLSPEPGWHTYWRNSGDSGEAPTVSWQTNAPLSFGDIQWPLPHAIPVAHLVNYGYDSNNLLMVTVTAPADLPLDQPINIVADLSWLVCKEDCIPGWATLSITLPVQTTNSPSTDAPIFSATQQLLPQQQQLSGQFEITEEHIVVQIADIDTTKWYLFPFRSDLIQHAAPQTIIEDSGVTRFLIPRSAYFNGKAEQLDWLLSDGKQAYYLTTLANLSSSTTSKSMTLFTLLSFSLMAFVGGLILNLMPCVLPILSIKAMALQSTQQSLSHKLAYLVGVVLCFNLFALIIFLLQQSGQQVGWGFHMQEPIVVVSLAFLFTFIALVLLDALSVSSRFSGIGQSLVAGDSAGAHFATGALAVVVASPCTAPFMAAALGIALVSQPYVTFIIFNALALGFALPMTLLFLSRRAMAWLPKPGVWMQTFKQFLAFPMFITVAWLCWVYAGQAGSQAQFALLLALICFSMFAWLLSRSVKSLAKGLYTVGLVMSLVLPYVISVNINKPTIGDSKQTHYSPFETKLINKLRDENQVVLVNMTADWCITCKVNEQVAFSSDKVTNLFAQEDVHYIVGDWTNKNREILTFLNQYERAGVPLYVVYAGRQYEQVLPQILTPATIIDAINTAKEELYHVK